VTAVAVWDHIPTPDELLKVRLEEGWQPRPSLLKEGDLIVGHAACVVVKAAERATGDLDIKHV
jgi:hypothetical protein